MLDRNTAQAVLDEIAYPGYSFSVHGEFGPTQATYLQATFNAPDNDHPESVETQHTRKWLLSRHMTRSELVQTAFKCVLTAIEHEAREQFTYRGQRIFGPHFDVNELALLCAMRRYDVRANQSGEA